MEKQYIARLSEQVERKTVPYKNRYGMELVGELYTAKNMDVTEKHPVDLIEVLWWAEKSGKWGDWNDSE